ncbi:hypothetical protein [Paenibacillus cymbidii]|uniref:hypothetical protein n=1 Tax=Paenibacillus cymbidii TaxID=1639034 RepID=UPI001081E764|nr:hypothetical protein [Paenibacillus cymbidii]
MSGPAASAAPSRQTSPAKLAGMPLLSAAGIAALHAVHLLALPTMSAGATGMANMDMGEHVHSHQAAGASGMSLLLAALVLANAAGIGFGIRTLARTGAQNRHRFLCRLTAYVSIAVGLGSFLLMFAQR